MHDDPIATLERELVSAARRRVRLSPPVALPPVAMRRRRGSMGAFAAVALAGLAVVVALGALVSLRAQRPPANPAPARSAPNRSRQQLIDILGVLRRPQMRVDLAASRWLPPGWGTVDTSLIRRATVTPWGEPVYVIPVRQPGRSEAISLLVGSGGGCCALAADIVRFGQETTEGAGRSYAGGSTRTRITVLVPDGVATVELVLPHPVTVRVHANVAAVQVDQACCAGPPAMIWRGAHGQVVRRVGGAVPRAGSAPRLGPETVLSRAAERDPSTPNRVWVTPAVGGPHTAFTLHFEVLLNDADYRYRLSGTPCPAITVNGGDGGGTNDLRGRIGSDQVDAVAGQTWCPGTYHLSATVMDLGRYGNLKHPASPFGTATFTVKG
jgi:hypothetical protein